MLLSLRKGEHINTYVLVIDKMLGSLYIKYCLNVITWASAAAWAAKPGINWAWRT